MTLQTEYLSTKQAARLINWSHRTLERWRLEGRGPRYIQYPNGHVRYPRKELVAWAENTGWLRETAAA